MKKKYLFTAVVGVLAIGTAVAFLSMNGQDLQGRLKLSSLKGELSHSSPASTTLQLGTYDNPVATYKIKTDSTYDIRMKKLALSVSSPDALASVDYVILTYTTPTGGTNKVGASLNYLGDKFEFRNLDLMVSKSSPRDINVFVDLKSTANGGVAGAKLSTQILSFEGQNTVTGENVIGSVKNKASAVMTLK